MAANVDRTEGDESLLFTYDLTAPQAEIRFLADDAVVFEALWSRRQDVVIASAKLQGADFVSSVVVAGLHALRAMSLPRHALEQP